MLYIFYFEQATPAMYVARAIFQFAWHATTGLNRVQVVMVGLCANRRFHSESRSAFFFSQIIFHSCDAICSLFPSANSARDACTFCCNQSLCDLSEFISSSILAFRAARFTANSALTCILRLTYGHCCAACFTRKISTCFGCTRYTTI